MFANKKWLKVFVWIAATALLYFAYDGWKSYRYQQSQNAERRAQEALAARKAELRRQKHELSERFKTRLEARRILRSGELRLQIFNNDAEQPYQTRIIPFVLEIGQELELPVINHEGKTVRLKTYIESPDGAIKPVIMFRSGDTARSEKSGWARLGDGSLLRDRSQLKLSLRPDAHSWGEAVNLSAPDYSQASEGALKLFLLSPSRARTELSSDNEGKFEFTPAESGLWRYLWYVENEDRPTQSQPIKEGVFFVIYPDSRERINVAVQPFYHRLSKARNESKDYQVNQLVRALSEYGRRGVKESSYVDEQLKLIRSKKPQTVKTSEPDASSVIPPVAPSDGELTPGT